MMKLGSIVRGALICLLAASCAQETGEPLQPRLFAHEIKAVVPGEVDSGVNTRVQVNPANDLQFLWSAQESIGLFSGGVSAPYLFTGTNTEVSANATFHGNGPADLGLYTVLYPYDSESRLEAGTVSTRLPWLQTGQAGTFADGVFILAGQSSTDEVVFKHVCSGLRFKPGRADITAVTLQGNQGEGVAGSFSFTFNEGVPQPGAGNQPLITLTAPGGGTFAADTWYYIVVLPGHYSGGITLTAYAGSYVGSFSTGDITFELGRFKQISNLSGKLSESTASVKVYYGEQNTFLARPGNSITVDVTPRYIAAHWQRSGAVAAEADAAASAAVLWGSAIASLSGSTLTMSSASAGSSLIAIKNASGTVLWSYLLWVTESAPAETTLPGGANVLPALGGDCYFQWGRKDPLLKSGGVVTNQGTGGLAYSLANPTVFIEEGTYAGKDWYADSFLSQDSELWGESGAKTVWDPCPAGYRVPPVSAFSGITSEELLNTYFEGLGYLGGGREYISDYVNYWTRSTEMSGDYRSISSALDGEEVSYDYLSTGYRYMAYPVRCVKE